MQIYILKMSQATKILETIKSCFSDKSEISEKIFLILNFQK